MRLLLEYPEVLHGGGGGGGGGKLRGERSCMCLNISDLARCCRPSKKGWEGEIKDAG